MIGQDMYALERRDDLTDYVESLHGYSFPFSPKYVFICAHQHKQTVIVLDAKTFEIVDGSIWRSDDRVYLSIRGRDWRLTSPDEGRKFLLCITE